MTVDEINHLLWQLDPMNTSCNVNEGMEDEYWSQASEIAEQLAKGEAARAAITATFDFWFWEDCLRSSPDDSRIDDLAQAKEAIPPRP